MDLERTFLRLTSRSEAQRQHGADASSSHLSPSRLTARSEPMTSPETGANAGVHVGAALAGLKFFFRLWDFCLMAFSSKSDSFLADCKGLRECLGKGRFYLQRSICMNIRSAGERVPHPRGLPPTVVILCRCRHRLLPLHRLGNMAVQRPGPQQLHLPLGGSGGTKGKKIIHKRGTNQRS